MKEALSNTGFMHIAVGTWDTFNEKLLLELGDKAENLQFLKPFTMEISTKQMGRTNINEADIKHFEEKII